MQRRSKSKRDSDDVKLDCVRARARARVSLPLFACHATNKRARAKRRTSSWGIIWSPCGAGFESQDRTPPHERACVLECHAGGFKL